MFAVTLIKTPYYDTDHILDAQRASVRFDFPSWIVCVACAEDKPVFVLEQTLWRCNHIGDTLSTSPQELRKRSLLSGTTPVLNS